MAEKNEKLIEKIQMLRPIDDTFFEVLADDVEFCEEILQIILQDKKLKVLSVIVQKSVRNLVGRSVRVDALCQLGSGEKVNIEVQRSDKDHHLKRIHGIMHPVLRQARQNRENYLKMFRQSLWYIFLNLIF